MKTVTRKYKVYKFDELGEAGKEKAINEYIAFMLETRTYKQGSKKYRKALDKAEAMHTPWFSGSYVYDYCHDEIIDEIKFNDYDFFESGDMFNL